MLQRWKNEWKVQNYTQTMLTRKQVYVTVYDNIATEPSRARKKASARKAKQYLNFNLYISSQIGFYLMKHDYKGIG